MTESKDNPRVDISNVTVAAFNAIKNQEKKTQTKLRVLGRDDNTYYNSPNFKVKVRAWTQADNNSHSYFHSLSIDVNVDDFMGTAELKCPYDSDLMEYWEPIRNDVVIYGSNRGPEKILFIGRVRGVKQDGYEMVIEFQNYAWKFKQLVTQSYANDNVLNKDGYTILRLMFEALKIDSWVISPAAKKRLKSVGMNQDGNVTVNGKEVEKMPDLLERLKKSNPNDSITKDTLNNKLREKYVHNIKDINYTLKYEKPTKVMKKIASQGSYTAGSNIYSNPYGSASSSGGGGGAGGTNASAANVQGCYTLDVSKACPAVRDGTMQSCMRQISSFNRGCTNDFGGCDTAIVNYASSSSTNRNYLTQVSPCLGTLSKNVTRKDRTSKCADLKKICDARAQRVTNNSFQHQINNGVNAVNSWYKTNVTGFVNWVSKGAQDLGQNIYRAGENFLKGIGSWLK